MRARVLGMLVMRDDKGPDEKILTVADHDPRWQGLHDIEDVPGHLRDEIGHFFSIYRDLEQKRVVVDGWRSRRDAFATVAEARARAPRPGERPGPFPT